MALFSAYFDDSGKSSQGSVVSFGGAVSTVAKWDKLESAWLKTLQTKGLSQLHMKELFRHVKGAEAEALMAELSGIVTKHTNKTFAYCVSLPGWRSVNRRYMLQEEAGSPPVLAGLGCVAMLKSWSNGKADLKDIQIIFEQGSEDHGALFRLCKKQFGVDIAIAGKSVVPLQVGDFVAWHARRHMVDVPSVPDFVRRGSYDNLLRKASMHKYVEKDHLLELCKLQPITVRAGSSTIKP